MVVLSEGGFYADLDTDCRSPLDDLIQPGDQMIVGWEHEFSTVAEKQRKFYARQRQERDFFLYILSASLEFALVFANDHSCLP